MPVIEAQRASILVTHDHRHINHEYAFVYCYCSGCVGFEPRGTEVVSCAQARGGVQGGRQAPQQGNGGLGAAIFCAPDLAGRRVRARPGRRR